MTEGICFACGSDELNYDALEVDGEFVYYPWTCKKCGAQGEENYKLSFTDHSINYDPREVEKDPVGFDKYTELCKLHGGNNEEN